MSEKSIVYWAPPNELISALTPSTAIMKTNNLVKTRLLLDKILDNINSGDKVGIKVHVGEAYNTHYLRHDYIFEVVNAVKAKGGIPTLIETQGLGMEVRHRTISENYTITFGSRKTATEHYNTARLHGYTESIIGAPLKFIDGEKGFDAKISEIDGIHLKKIVIAAGLFEFDKIIIVSHFKGHGLTCFGGAMKQLGIGCLAKLGKFRAHFNENLSINSKKCNISKCDQECIKACPVNAIKIEGESAIIDPSICVGCTGCLESCPVKRAINQSFNLDFENFTERVVDNAAGVLSSYNRENIRYINFAMDVTSQCDCVSSPNMSIIPDLGIFASSDPVAIDKACVDAEINAPGLPILNEKGQWTQPVASGIEKFHAMNNSVNTSYFFNAAVKSKLGNIEYELVKI